MNETVGRNFLHFVDYLLGNLLAFGHICHWLIALETRIALLNACRYTGCIPAAFTRCVADILAVA